MTNKENSIGPEMIEAVSEIIKDALGVDFATFYALYRLEGEHLTEQDMIQDILEAGQYQAEAGTSFDDAVIIGAIAIGGPLGLV